MFIICHLCSEYLYVMLCYFMLCYGCCLVSCLKNFSAQCCSVHLTIKDLNLNLKHWSNNICNKRERNGKKRVYETGMKWVAHWAEIQATFRHWYKSSVVVKHSNTTHNLPKLVCSLIPSDRIKDLTVTANMQLSDANSVQLHAKDHHCYLLRKKRVVLKRSLMPRDWLQPVIKNDCWWMRDGGCHYAFKVTVPCLARKN